MFARNNPLLWITAIVITLACRVAIAGDKTAAGATADKPAADVKAEADKVAPKKLEKVEFVRVKRDKKNVPQTLETALTTYERTDEDGKKVVVDLIGAVHIADAAYYKDLNKRFKQYDALLYELVAPRNVRPHKGQRSGSILGSLQRGSKDLLDLAFQLDHVNYKAKNFVHADMSPKEFSASMKRKGESTLTMAFRLMGHGMATNAKSGNVDDFRIMAALMSKNPSLQLKRVLSSQFTDIDAANEALGGKDGSTIINERNKKALEVLQKQLKGKGTSFGIFYGAAHLPDMERRLVEDFKFKRTKVQWLKAWDMTE